MVHLLGVNLGKTSCSTCMTCNADDMSRFTMSGDSIAAPVLSLPPHPKHVIIISKLWRACSHVSVMQVMFSFRPSRPICCCSLPFCDAHQWHTAPQSQAFRWRASGAEPSAALLRVRAGILAAPRSRVLSRPRAGEASTGRWGTERPPGV